MSLGHSPSIVTSGLVFCLDSGNSKSYSSNRLTSYGTGNITENITFALQGDGVFQRVATGTIIGGYEVAPNDVVYSYTLGSLGCHYHGNDFTIPAGSYVTFSFDYLVTGATGYPSNTLLANLENGGGGALGGAIGVPNNLQDVWQRVSVTSGPTASQGTQKALLYPGGCSPSRLATTGTIYYRNPKLELSSFDSGSNVFSSTTSLTSIRDLSGNNNSGTLTNNPVYSSEKNGFFIFDGVDDYIPINTTSNFPFGSSPGTISAWAYTTTITGSYKWIISYGTASTGQARFLGIQDSTFLFGGYGGTPPDISASGVPLNTWFNMCGTYDGANARIYINGSLVSGPTARSWNTVAGNAQIGRQVSPGEYWSGRIGQVSIYNKALTASEITQNFSALRSRYGI